ncbi:adenylate cyclase, terminal-differentiation specific-like [Centruroides vittatus]|uniref:adenylate cyclase, terminal-differentiation specific-like n=1 Tax=Centruroides vittatus TaxID=120091 RepID=UPI00350EE81F
MTNQRYGQYSQHPGYEGYQYSGSQYYDYPEYGYYPSGGQYEGQYGYQARRVLRQVRNVLQRTQYYTERKLEEAQQSLSQYEQSGQQPSQQEQQLIQEVKSEAHSLQQQIYKYLQYPQEEGNYEGSQQVARILYQVQYILQAAQYYSQRQLGRAQYILSRYEQSDYEPSQQARQLLQEVQEQASYLREQIYQGTQYFLQNSGDEDYSRQQYGQYYGYQQYSHDGYEANRYYESYQGQQYDSQLNRVLSQVRYVLHSAQQRSQQRLQQAQELYAEHQQPGNQVQRLAQQLRFQASYVQQQVYEYTQYDQGYGGYESTGYSGFRSQLQQLREMVEQGVDTETIETYVGQNFPSGSEVAESIRQQLRHGRQQLRRYLEEAIGSGYSAYNYDPSSSDYQRVRSSFERRYGLPYSDDYYEFARYVVQTYDADLSTASTSSTVRQLAEHFLAHVSQVGEGVLQHALEFFRQYRPQVGEYYYRAVRDAVRQRLDE